MKLDVFTKRGIARVIMWTIVLFSCAVLIIKQPLAFAGLLVLFIWVWSVINSGVND